MTLRDDKKRRKLGSAGELQRQQELARERTQQRARELEQAALSLSTQRAYASGTASWARYAQECGHDGEQVPHEDRLRGFVGWLSEAGKGAAGAGMEASTVEVYLAAVRDKFLRQGAGCVLANKLLLKKAVTGWQKKKGTTKDKRRPVTVAMLQAAAPLVDWNTHDVVLAWLVIVWGVLGLFRLGELLPRSRGDKEHTRIRAKDIRYDGKEGVLSVDLRASKTDTYGQGVTVTLQAQQGGGRVCPATVWKRVVQLRAERQVGEEDAFMTKANGSMLIKGEAVEVMNVWFGEVDRQQGIHTDEKFCGHSLRKGGATSLSLRGVEDSLIQVLGRWRSDAYKAYTVLNKTVLKEARDKMMRTQESDLAIGKTRWTGGKWQTE